MALSSTAHTSAGNRPPFQSTASSRNGRKRFSLMKVGSKISGGCSVESCKWRTVRQVTEIGPNATLIFRGRTAGRPAPSYTCAQAAHAGCAENDSKRLPQKLRASPSNSLPPNPREVRDLVPNRHVRFDRCSRRLASGNQCAAAVCQCIRGASPHKSSRL